MSFQSLLAANVNEVSVMVLPGAPEHAAVALNTATPELDLNLTWDASPSLTSDIASYTVFYKTSTDPSYPVTPQITRTDALPNYSENIAISAGVTYNFIVYANSVSSIRSTDNCASCRVTYTPPSGGGGGSNIPLDNTNPTPGTASSPAYANSVPITVTYSGASDVGGSGLSYVELIAKKGTGNWQNTGLTSSGLSGSFDYTPSGISANMTFYFDLIAYDNQGNQSASPSANGDTKTVYDTEAPIVNKITIPTSATSTPILISYENAVDVGIAGLDHVELWYKKGATGTWTDSGLTGITASGAFNFESVTDPDYYYFDLIAADKAGNRSIEDGETKTPTVFDNKAPILGSITVPASSSVSPLVVSYTGAADVGPAGLKKVELWYKKESAGIWTNSGLTAATPSGAFNFIPSANGTYYFDFVLEDNFGNQSLPVTGGGIANVVYASTPVVAVFSTLPPATTELTTASVTVGGTGVTAYKYKLDSEVYGAETLIATQITLSGLSVGAHTLSVIGKNASGTWQSLTSPTTYSWTINVLPAIPVVAVLSTLPPATTELTTASVTVGGTGVTAYKYKLDSEVYGAETLIATQITLSGLSVGAHTLSVIGKNAAGTWQSIASPTTHSWTITAPVIVPVPVVAVLSTLPPSSTELTNASITVGGTDVTAYQYKFDSGVYSAETPVAAKITFISLASGTHTVSVIGKNAAGTWQSAASPTTYTWTITAPEIVPVESVVAVLSTVPPATTEQTTASVTVGGTGVTAYQYILDTGVYSEEIPVETRITLSNLTVGVHTLSVIGKNAAGTWQDTASPTAYSWTINASTVLAPVVAVLSTLPSATTDQTTADITVGGTDVVAYKIMLDDANTYGNETPADSKISLTNLSVGVHTLSVIGKNSADNWQSLLTPTTYSWTVTSVSAVPELEIPHCENAVQDADEYNVDCGGSECPICVDVLFTILAQPAGREFGDYGQDGALNLFSARTGRLIKSPPILTADDGTKTMLVKDIPLSTYQIGIKDNGYLQKILRSIVIGEGMTEKTLDFTLGGTFKLIGGDVFNDNIINSFDLALLLNNYFKADKFLDLNQDGRVNAADLATILQHYQLRGDSP